MKLGCSSKVNWPLSFTRFAMQIALNLLLIFILTTSQHAHSHRCEPCWSFQWQGVPQWPSSTLSHSVVDACNAFLSLWHFFLTFPFFCPNIKVCWSSANQKTNTMTSAFPWKTLTEYSQAGIARANNLLHVGAVDAELTALELNCDHLYLNLFWLFCPTW